MDAIGNALALTGAAISITLICAAGAAMVGWFMFYRWIRVKKPIQATLAVTIAAMWMLGAIFGVA